MTERNWQNWKDCHKGLYSVSRCGEVRNSRTGRILKKCLTKGYEIITISEKGNYTTARVHCLVAEAFIGPRPKGSHINHKDGNKTNNHVSNLEYCTPTENVQHALKNGLADPMPNRKLTDRQISAIKTIYKTGYFSYKEIAKKFGVSFSAIQFICTGYRWRNIK